MTSVGSGARQTRLAPWTQHVRSSTPCCCSSSDSGSTLSAR
jgi:hypothetical protein